MSKRNKAVIKRKIAVVIMLVTFLCLVGCANNNEEKNVSSNADEHVNLKFMWWGNDTRKELTEQVISLYESQNPHVTIETEVVSNTNVIARTLAIYTARQTVPDIIQTDYNFVFNYITRELIEPLDEYTNNGILNIADIEPQYLEGGYWKDKLYALPMGVNSQALGYNVKLFKDAGVEVPAAGYTMEQFEGMLRALKQAINRTDFYPLANMIDLNYFIRAYGASLYNSTGDGLGYDDDSIMENYYAYMKKWKDEGLLHPNTSTSSINDKHPMITRESAIASISTNTVTTLNVLTTDQIRLMSYPVTKDGISGNYIKPSMFLTISSYSKHKEEAAKFIDFMTNSEAANDILNGERGVPISSKIAAHLSGKLDEHGQAQYEYIDFLKENSRELDPPNPSNHVVVNKSFELIRDNVLVGKISPSEGAKQYRAEAIAYLSNNRGEQ